MMMMIIKLVFIYITGYIYLVLGIRLRVVPASMENLIGNVKFNRILLLAVIEILLACCEYTDTVTRVDKKFNRDHFNHFLGLSLPLYAECNIHTSTPGMCLRFDECAMISGIVTGACSATSVCCTVSLQCGQSSNTKVIIIDQSLQSTSAPVHCNYVIKRFSASVCQLRVDFDTFLPQPSYVSAISPPYTYPDCSLNYLAIGEYKFCGENINQHIYLQFEQKLISEAISVQISENQQAVWKLIVTQLECQTSGIRDSAHILPKTMSRQTSSLNPSPHDIVPYLSDRKINFQKFHRKQSLTYDLIAPNGCLQYFPNATGIFESFNYNRGIGPFLPNMQYAICFDRQTFSSSIKFAVERFQMSSNADISIAVPMTDGDCIDEQAATEIASNDFFLIPYSIIMENGIKGTRFCGNILESLHLVSSPPGPFMVIINTGNMYLPPSFEKFLPRAFRIRYTLV